MVVRWLGSAGKSSKDKAIDVSDQFTAIYLPSHGWISCELNSTPYFDRNRHLMYTAPLLLCRSCAIRGVSSCHISCRTCLPPSHDVAYGIILETYTGRCYVIDVEEGKCQFFPHGPKDPSTLLRRASRLTKNSNGYRRAISISGLSSSLDLTLAFFAVYPIASFSSKNMCKSSCSEMSRSRVKIWIHDWGRIISSSLCTRTRPPCAANLILICVTAAFRSYLWNVNLRTRFVMPSS